ncbi:MAG: hypothetical protein ABIE84_05030 [bacterium]
MVQAVSNNTSPAQMDKAEFAKQATAMINKSVVNTATKSLLKEMTKQVRKTRGEEEKY